MEAEMNVKNTNNSSKVIHVKTKDNKENKKQGGNKKSGEIKTQNKVG